MVLISTATNSSKISEVINFLCLFALLRRANYFFLIRRKNTGKFQMIRMWQFQIFTTTHPNKHNTSNGVCTNKIQQDATDESVYLLHNYSTCFGCLSHPLSGVHQTVTAASGTGHTIRAKTLRQRGLIRPRWWKVVALILWPVPVAAVTVRCWYLFTAQLLYMFRVSIAPIIRSTSNCNSSFWYRSLPWYYELYQKLLLQFDVLLIMGAIDTRNM